MDLSEGIRKHGFRKWYERELIQGHMHLVLTLFSAIGLLAAMEVLAESSGLDRLLNLLAVVVCSLVGLWAIRRYLYLLMHAEALANQAVCPVCQTYGRLDLANDAPQPAATVAELDRPVRVCCRKCGQHWNLMP